MKMQFLKYLMIPALGFVFDASARDAGAAKARKNIPTKAKTLDVVKPKAPEASSEEQTKDFVEFSVNGKTIRHSEIERVLKQAIPPQEAGKMNTEQHSQYKKYVENMLIANILLREQAEKTHVDRDKEFRAALQRYKEQLMVTFYIQKFLRDRIQQGNVVAKIQQLKPELQKKKEKKVCFILTTKEEDAKKAIADLDAGKDFVEVAKSYSSLPNDAAKEQAAKGAYMPVMEKMPMLPEELSVAINTLEKGTYSKTPVKAGNDFYVIKIEDERALQLPDETIAKIAYQQLRAEELKGLINNLIKTAAIKRMDENGAEVPFDKAPINPEELVRAAA